MVIHSRYPKLRNLVLFCVQEDVSLSSLKLSLSYAPHLSRASILFQHPELPFLRAHCREWPQSHGYQAEGILLPECPQASVAHVGGLQSLMTVTSLFTDMTGSSISHSSWSSCFVRCSSVWMCLSPHFTFRLNIFNRNTFYGMLCSSGWWQEADDALGLITGDVRLR